MINLSDIEYQVLSEMEDYEGTPEHARVCMDRFGELLLDEVYERIKHGDDEHRMWLASEFEKMKKEL